MCWQDWAEMFSAALMSELCSEGHFWLFMWTQRNIPQDSHQLDFKRVHFYRSVVSLWPPHHLTSCRLGVPTLSWCLRSQQVESQAVYDINNIPLTTVEATFGDISYLSTSTKQSISSSLFLFFNFSGKKKKKNCTQTNRRNGPFWSICTLNNRIYFPPLFFLQTEPLLSASSPIPRGEPPSVAHRPMTSTLAL